MTSSDTISSRTHYALAELAQRFDLRVQGDSEQTIHSVASLAEAGPQQLGFLANPRYRTQLATTHAGAIVLSAADAPLCNTPALIARDPYVAFAKIAALFEPVPTANTGVHISSIVEPGAHIAAGVCIGALCVIAADAVIEQGAVLGPGCIVGPKCRIGAHTRLVARVTLVANVTLGQRVLIHPGAIIGADGFGIAFDQDHWIKVPQLGGVRIGDDCEIGANTTIDRGTLGDTVLEEDVRLDNQIQIAHNVVIGAHTAMAGSAAVAGSAKIGRYCLIGGGVGILGHIELADHVTVTARTLVTHSLPIAGEYSSGTPVQENRAWRRNAARYKHLDDFARRLQILEKEKSQ